MEGPTRQTLFENASKLLSAEFERAKADVPHMGERGKEVEDVLKIWLNGHLPQRYRAASGFIIDDVDQISGQTDVIVYDALNSPVLRYSASSLIVPADNSAAAFEVKSKLTKATFDDACSKIAKIKALRKSAISDLDVLSEGAAKIVQWQTYCIIYAFESDCELETVGMWYRDRMRQPGALVGHPDLVVVLNKGWLDLTLKDPGKDNIEGYFHQPGPLFRPAMVPPSTALCIVCHSQVNQVLLTLVRRLGQHLQLFRTKSYQPYVGLFDGSVAQAVSLIEVGQLPDYPPNYRDPTTTRTTLVQKAEQWPKGKNKKRRLR